MKNSHLIFTLCAVSASISHSMQLTLKTNPHKLKQIRQITSHKELQTTVTKSKKRKDNQCDNCCIVEKKEQIKDFMVHTSNNLQSRFSTYNSKYGSKFFVEDSGANFLLGFNVMVGMIHAGHSLAFCNPAYLLPIITNVAAIKFIKLDTDLINSVKQPRLVRDLISYVKATNNDDNIFGQQNSIEDKIEAHKEINLRTLSSLGLKTALNDYDVKLVELEKSRDIINNKILEPILPILSKYKDDDIEKCLTYANELHRTTVLKQCLLIGGSVIISLSTFNILCGTGYIITPMLSVFSAYQLVLAGLGGNIGRGDLLDKTQIVSRYLKTYKDHLKTIQNSAPIKILKNKKNTE
jgi:hypothetical protein